MAKEMEKAAKQRAKAIEKLEKRRAKTGAAWTRSNGGDGKRNQEAGAGPKTSKPKPRRASREIREQPSVPGAFDTNRNGIALTPARGLRLRIRRP
jgi:hypothetical protein